MATAQAVHQFIKEFLTDPATGALYVSQNADLRDGEENEAYFKLDDKGRRVQGLPRIDRKASLCAGERLDHRGLERPLCSKRRCIGSSRSGACGALRALPEGGFRHDQVNANGPYLGDTLAMGWAFLALYNVTAKRDYLTRAAQAAQFIAAHFATRTSRWCASPRCSP